MEWTHPRGLADVFRFRVRPARRSVVLFAAIQCAVFLAGAVLTVASGRNPVCAATGWILLMAQMLSIAAPGLAAVLRS